MKINYFNINKRVAVSISVMSLMFFGCQKQLDINHNPSVATVDQASPNLIFPAAVLATASRVGGDLAIVGGMWSQHCTQAVLAQQYTDIDSYNLTNTDAFVSGASSSWTALYTNGLKNYQIAINEAKASGDWNFFLLNTVMKAYTYEILADLYDQVPYTQALLGSANLQPKFDSGLVVYQGLLGEIDTALSKDFTASTNTAPGTSDMVFGGTISSWIQFANTLKLKMYLRMINARPDLAQAGITALYSNNPSFLSSDASMTNFTSGAEQDNPMFEQNMRSLNILSNLKASTTFVSWLVNNKDSRVFKLFDSANSTLAGFFPSTSPNPNSINQGDYNNSSNAAYQTAPIFGETPTDPVEFISLAESYFLQAEADLRYFGGNNAQSLYNQGVLTAFGYYGLDGSSYVASGGAYEFPASGTPDQKIQSIITQKWASCAYGCHGIEAFFEKCRTGYPLTSSVYSTSPSYVPGQLVISKNSVLAAGLLPKRFVFPYDERAKNSNTPAEVSISTPVWWGK
jgi:Starch-binding associating with outer membrane